MVQVVTVGEEVDSIEVLDARTFEVAGAMDKVEMIKAKMKTLVPSRNSNRRDIDVSSSIKSTGRQLGEEFP